jgi:hypothetical protein
MELEILDLEDTPVDDDMILYEGIDLDDETRLRDLVSIVEELLRLPRRETIGITALNDEVWNQVLQLAISRSIISPQTKQFVQILAHPDDPFKLLVNPECVRQLNGKGSRRTGELNRKMVAEVLYALLRHLPSKVPTILRRGLNDQLAVEAARRAGVELTPFYPANAMLLQGLCRILAHTHGYSTIDWQVVLFKTPERFCTALRKTPFAEAWVRAAKRHPAIAAQLENNEAKPRQALIELLCAPDRTIDDDLVHLTLESIFHYLESERIALQ